MKRKFKTENTFKIKSRNLFVLTGTILEGPISKGMLIKFDNDIEKLIYDIGFIDYVSERKSLIGLAIKYKNLEELQYFKNLKLEDTILDVYSVPLAQQENKKE